MSLAGALRTRLVTRAGLIALLGGCTVTPGAPLSPPSIDDAQALLQEVVEAGIDRDWERLCANASGTCEAELRSNEERAPRRPPRVAGVEVYQASSAGRESTSGGVLFTLCGADGFGDPYQSEVFIFDDGSRLLATAAVYWIGTKVGVDSPPFTTGEGGPARC